MHLKNTAACATCAAHMDTGGSFPSLSVSTRHLEAGLHEAREQQPPGQQTTHAKVNTADIGGKDEESQYW